MSIGTPVVSELLCFLQNNFSSTAKDLLVNRICSFYSTEESLAAKNLLFSTADKLKQDGLVIDLPRNVTRRNGDAKRKADTEDLIDLWVHLDVAKANVPTFCAADLRRLPPLSFTDTDVCGLAAMVLDMKGQLSEVQSKLVNIETHVKIPESRMPHHTGLLPHRYFQPAVSTTAAQSDPIRVPSVSSAPAVMIDSSERAEPQSTESQSARSWADICINPSHETIDSEGYTLVVGRKVRESSQKSVLRGKKILSTDSKIKAAPRRLTIFVGRLDKDVTPDVLKDYLVSAGIEDPVCKKLTAKDGKVFRTSAFMVSCDEKFRCALFDDANWPSGCEVRDWVFRRKDGDNSSG